MKILDDQDLSKYTTFRMGGIAKKMYMPESVEDVLSLYKNNEAPRYLIGGGSNLLINDARTFDYVVCLKEFNKKFVSYGEGKYYIGASIRLQEAIKRINDDNYGGIEYLFSVPGLIGGAICMNAGRGKQHNKCVSDYLISVDCIIDGELRQFSKNECKFTYRNSVFQRLHNCVVVGGLFQFEEVMKLESDKRITERINLCKEVQDNSKPNFGTVFCVSDARIMRVVKKFNKIFSKGKITFSKKTENWMLHDEGGTFSDAVALIDKVQRLHKFLKRECKTEVKIWN